MADMMIATLQTVPAMPAESQSIRAWHGKKKNTQLMGHKCSESEEDKRKEAKLKRQVRANHGERALLGMPGPKATVTQIAVYNNRAPLNCAG